MKAEKYIQFDCSELETEISKHGITPINVRELQNADHVGFGGVKRFEYVNPNGITRYVLEQYGMYSADSYVCNSWQFAENFTDVEAGEFLIEQRNA